MKRIILAIFMLTNLAFSGDFEDGHKAYQKGDNKKAFILLKQSCDSGNANGCNNLGNMYEFGAEVKPNYFKAIELYQKACYGGNAEGCNNLGNMYKIGKGIEKDYFKAKQFYGRACNLKNELGCQNYTILNSQGY